MEGSLWREECACGEFVLCERRITARVVAHVEKERDWPEPRGGDDLRGVGGVIASRSAMLGV